jgi:hypothetical protein
LLAEHEPGDAGQVVEVGKSVLHFKQDLKLKRHSDTFLGYGRI